MPRYHPQLGPTLKILLLTILAATVNPTAAIESLPTQGHVEDRRETSESHKPEKVSWAIRATRKPVADFYNIQSEWKSVDENANSIAHFTLDGLQLWFGAGSKVAKKYHYAIDTVHEPHRIDIFTSEDDSAPKSRSVYQLDGDTLHLCIPPAGKHYPDSVNNPSMPKCRRYTFQRAQRTIPSIATREDRQKVLDEIEACYGGINRPVNHRRAADLIIALADSGDPLGSMWLAKCLHKGICGFVADKASSQELASTVVNQVETLAKGGNPHAQVLWGNAIELRLGTDAIEQEKRIRHYEKQDGRYWYELAMAQGNVAATYERGLHSEFFRRRGTESRRYYRSAVEKGHTLAKERIATHLAAGTECRQDERKSLIYFDQTAKSGSIYAISMIGRITRFDRDDSNDARSLLA